MDRAFQLLQDMKEEGMVPGENVCSGLLLACMTNRQFELARGVYDLCASKVG